MLKRGKGVVKKMNHLKLINSLNYFSNGGKCIKFSHIDY